MNDQETIKNSEPDIWILPKTKIVALGLIGAWHYRDLVWMLVKRDFIAFYKQTVLGPIWYLIQPTVTAFTYFLVFGKIANIPTNSLHPFLFYMSGIVIWNYFSVCLTSNSETFSKNASLFGKVYFPRVVVPIATALNGVLTLVIQFGLLVIVSIGFVLTDKGGSLSGWVFVFLPFIVAYVGALGMGVGLIVSALTVRFRDLAFIASFATQLWMYATPVVYPFSQIPERYQWFYYLNPMTAPVETLRSVMYGARSVSWQLWTCNAVVMISLLMAGLILFSRAESNAMDTI